MRGYVHEVVIACGAEVIARHPRSWEKEDYIYDPLQYLALIEQKATARDQATPLADWELPKAFATLRRLMEARMVKKGKREFVQVLRLLEHSGSRMLRPGRVPQRRRCQGLEERSWCYPSRQPHLVNDTSLLRITDACRVEPIGQLVFRPC